MIARGALAAGFTLVSALLAAGLGLTPLLQQLELKTYDARLRAVATGAGATPAIAQVLIDDHSIRQLEPIVGRWPWPRMVHAVLVDFLARGPATLVVYDVLFSEEAKGTTDIGGTTWTGAESDDALVQAVAKAGNVILAAEASSEGLIDASQNVQPRLDGIPSLQTRWPLTGFAERRPLLMPPFPALARAARGIGHARLAYDADGPARRYVPFVEVGRPRWSRRCRWRRLPGRRAALRPEQVSASRAALRPRSTRACRGSSRSCPTTTARRRPCGAGWCRFAGRRCAPTARRRFRRTRSRTCSWPSSRSSPVRRRISTRPSSGTASSWSG